jgi:hypothetical protein
MSPARWKKCGAVGIGACVLGIAWLFVSPTMSKSDPRPSDRLLNRPVQTSIRPHAELEIPSPSSDLILDRSMIDEALLLSKKGTTSETSSERMQPCGELWLRDRRGEERLIARDVVSAKFSPDGSKIAYATAQHELLVETVEGESLARIARVIEPNWCDDGDTLSFLAIPSFDYPEIQHLTFYDLSTNRIIDSEKQDR